MSDCDTNVKSPSSLSMDSSDSQEQFEKLLGDQVACKPTHVTNDVSMF